MAESERVKDTTLHVMTSLYRIDRFLVYQLTRLMGEARWGGRGTAVNFHRPRGSEGQSYERMINDWDLQPLTCIPPTNAIFSKLLATFRLRIHVPKRQWDAVPGKEADPL